MSPTADVLVVGAGPTGLTLAAALAARGVAVTLLDRLAEGANTSRAGVVHARSLEVLEQIGVADRLVALGIRAGRFTVRDRDRVLMPVSFDRLPTRYPFALMVSQAVTERVLLERFLELGGTVRRPCTVVDVAQDEAGVTVTLEGGERLRAGYLVGADGMHSVVRERAGIAFTGGTYEDSFSLADVRLSGAAHTDEVVLYFSPAGMVVVAPLPGGLHRIVATVDSAPEHPTREYVQDLLDRRGPEHERVVVEEVTWGSRFRVHHRLADSYRAGRILLAGDAAHVHSPAGGQGMNTGIQDAVALARVLAEVLGGGPEKLLDGYGAARRPVAERVVAFADRLTRLATVGRRWRGVRNTLLGTVSRLPAVRGRLAWELAGLANR
jgi:2-polyprenyl-6-methoxyphenol hydroxylase-like FAD-dependent oxidoreductase